MRLPNLDGNELKGHLAGKEDSSLALTVGKTFHTEETTFLRAGCRRTLGASKAWENLRPAS